MIARREAVRGGSGECTSACARTPAAQKSVRRMF